MAASESLPYPFPTGPTHFLFSDANCCCHASELFGFAACATFAMAFCVRSAMRFPSGPNSLASTSQTWKTGDSGHERSTGQRGKGAGASLREGACERHTTPFASINILGHRGGGGYIGQRQQTEMGLSKDMGMGIGQRTKMGKLRGRACVKRNKDPSG